jgi:hypothetical protein
MELLCDVGHVESHFGSFRDSLTIVPFEIVVILMQYRCTFCAECTTGSEIILDAPDGTPR